MSRWWDTSMKDASQTLYADPSLAIKAGSVPQELMQSQADYKKDRQQAQKDSGGFMGTIARAFHKADSVMSNIPGWGIAKDVVWTPIDKTAQGLYWAYSNVISQPVSTLLLQAAKADTGEGWGTMFSGSEWSDAYHRAEHISPGQAFSNYENTVEASGNGTLLSGFFGDAGSEISADEKARVKQNMERFLYDTDYWKNKGGWKYNVGSGSIDFMFNMLDPVAGTAVGVSTRSVRAARSVQMVENKAYRVGDVIVRPKGNITLPATGLKSKLIPENLRGKQLVEGYESRAIQPTAEGAPSVVRTRGPVADIFAKGQTPEEVTRLPKMQQHFDWMKEDGRTVEEIANSPIWGRGRRINPARYDIAKLAHETPRENMEQLWRFTAGDSAAGRDLAHQAPEVLKKVGMIADNRVAIQSARLDPNTVAHIKTQQDIKYTPEDPNLLIEPPAPRPTTPGPRQDGWDARWGALKARADAARAQGNLIGATTPVRVLGPSNSLSEADAQAVNIWNQGKLDTIADDYNELINKQKYLGSVLGTMDNWTPAASPLFGTVQKAYRMGGLGVTDIGKAAEKRAVRSAGRRASVRPTGNFMMTTIKRGMAAPMTVVHAFGDRTPEGFVNHNSDDARDRVFDMLKQVRTMDPQERLDLIELYNQGTNKMERADALSKIHDGILNHMLVNDHGMDAELASALRESIKNGISEKLLKLKGGGMGRTQAFGPAATSEEDIAKLTGQSDELGPVRSDRVAMEEDGHGIIISPLAQTQLNASDILLPVKEIETAISRSASPMKKVRMGGGKALDITANFLDSFDNVWKTATLLRPGFIPRMVSDEIAARMFKFGAMATLMDGGRGMGHFFENRARQVWAMTGKGSYAPSTGKGIMSSHTRVVLDDEKIARAAEANGLPVSRIKVPPTLQMAYNRLSLERENLSDAQKELAKANRANAEAAKKGLSRAPYGGRYISALRDQVADHERVIQEHHDYIGEVLRVAEDSKGRRLGDGSFSYQIAGRSYRVPKAFDQEWDNPIPRDQISSSNAWKSLFTRHEQIDRQRFLSHVEKTGSYAQIDPDQPNHMEAWLDALNKQMRQDPFHRMIAGGATDKQALNWFRTPPGVDYMQHMGYWNRDREQFVRSVRYMMDKYLADDALKAKLANGDMITEADLRRAFTEDDFPIVHGEEVKEHTKIGHKETARAWMDKFNEKAWKMVADVPADVLSRHPVYLQLHQAEMQRLIRQQFHYKVQNFGDDTITPKEWEQLNQKAHRSAKNDMRQIVYDPKNTDGSSALRFVYPFFKPYIDGIDRWAGLVAERPEQLGKMAKIYNAPVAANLVTDQQGNHVDTDGYAMVKVLGADGKVHTERKFVPLKDRVVHLKAPWAKPGGKEFGAIRMASLNTILPGDPWFDPGTGPIVQVAGNSIAKRSPQMAEFMQWAKILPYGPSDSTMDLLTPKYLKDVYTAWHGADPDNKEYQQAWLDIYNMKTAQYYEEKKAGGHPQPPTEAEIAHDAKQFLWLKALTDWTAPASVKTSPLTGTHYQFFADQYKALQKLDPQNAQAKFLAQYGNDYIGFTAAMSKSIGLSATESADKMADKYHDLITEDPDMAPLVVGDVYNGGPFSSAVYQKQLHQEIGGKRVRRQLTAQEAIEDTRVQKGWREFMAGAHALDSQLIRAGFRSYSDRGAEGFSQAKQQLVEGIAMKNPAWATAYGTTDREKIPNRIRSMERIVQDPRLQNDPLRSDIKTLTAYLIVRNQMKQALAQRGLQEVSFDTAGHPTGQAADIGYAWRQYQMQFINASVSFGSLYHRYLENDNLQ